MSFMAELLYRECGVGLLSVWAIDWGPGPGVVVAPPGVFFNHAEWKPGPTTWKQPAATM